MANPLLCKPIQDPEVQRVNYSGHQGMVTTEGPIVTEFFQILE